MLVTKSLGFEETEVLISVDFLGKILEPLMCFWNCYLIHPGGESNSDYRKHMKSI